MKNYRFTLTYGNNLILDHAPAGWDEKTITFARHEYYHSVLRSYSLNLRFVFEAIPFILAAYEAEGINAVISIEIESLDRTDFTYGNFYSGILDLSEMKIMPDWVEVPIIDSDTLSRFIARDDMEIEMNRTETLDGEAITTGEFLEEVIINGVKIEENMSVTAPDLILTNENFSSRTVAMIGTWVQGDDDFKEIQNGSINSNFVYVNNTNEYVQIRFQINMSMVGGWDIDSGTYTISIVVALTGVTGSPVYLISETIEGSGAGTETIDIVVNHNEIYAVAPSSTMTAEIYGTYQVMFDSGGNMSEDLAFTWDALFTKITGAYEDTITNVALPYPLFTRALELMTGDASTLDADIIDEGGDAQYTAIASGLMIRRFPFSRAPLKIVFRDLFRSFSNVFNLGFFFNGSNFELKKIEEYYKQIEIASLGEVKDLQIEVANDKYFNEITSGYEKDISHDNVNGQSSTNVRFAFINSKKVKRQLDITSPFSGDDYSIELARKKQYTISSNEDTRYDNNNYLIYCIDDPEDGLKTAQGFDTFDEISGVPAEDTRLNLDISPKRNMLRCGNRVSLGEYISENDTKYISSKTTRKLITKKTDIPAVEEHAVVAYSDLDDPLYHPVYYNFSAPVTMDIMQAIMADPHGYFRFTFKGLTYGGFIHEVSTEPFQRQGNFTLLKVPFEII